ncbi:MAG: RNA polymerase sigma factor [Tepidisphaeraceae bacterium]
MRFVSAPATEPSDEFLIASLRDGDPKAGQKLVERHHEALFRYLYRTVGSSFQAEELLQQTWLSVLEHLDQFRPNTDSGAATPKFAFKAWLFRIATNKAHDFWRSKGRERNAYEGLSLVKDDVGPDASVGLTGSEEQAKLRRAIEQLPEAQRQVVTMRYFGGMKFVEIAETLGCPLNTALGRMHKAMIRLKKLMEEAPST